MSRIFLLLFPMSTTHAMSFWRFSCREINPISPLFNLNWLLNLLMTIECSRNEGFLWQTISQTIWQTLYYFMFSFRTLSSHQTYNFGLGFWKMLGLPEQRQTIPVEAILDQPSPSQAGSYPHINEMNEPRWDWNNCQAKYCLTLLHVELWT